MRFLNKTLGPLQAPSRGAMRSLVLVLASVLASLATASALAPVSSNLALRGGGFSRKTFSLGSCLQDHLDIMKSIPVSVSVSCCG